MSALAWAGVAAGIVVAVVGGVVFATRLQTSDRTAEPPLEWETPVGAAGPDPRDVTALARVIASEADGEPEIIQVAVGWAVVNEARRRGRSVFDVVAPGGDYGRQNDGGHSYVSSARLPTPAEQDLAAGILGGSVEDPTAGATNFDSPRAQRAAIARGVGGYKKTPEEVARIRIANGMEMVLLPGIPEERFRLWRYA